MSQGLKHSMKFKTRLLLNLSIILISISAFIFNIFTIISLQKLNKTNHSNSLQVGIQGRDEITEDYSFDDLISVSIALVGITILTAIISVINSIYVVFFPFKKIPSLNHVFSIVFTIFSLALNIGFTILIFTKGPTLINSNSYLEIPTSYTTNNTTINLVSNPFLYIKLWSIKSFLMCVWSFSIFSISSTIVELRSSTSINEQIGQKVIIIYDHFSNSNTTSKDRRSFPSTVPEKIVPQSILEF